MSPEPKPGVIGSLPRTRPHRRSDKRAASPAGAPPVDSRTAAEPEVVKAAAKPKRAAAKATGAAGTTRDAAAKTRGADAKPTGMAAKTRGAAAKPKRTATAAKPKRTPADATPAATAAQAAQAAPKAPPPPPVSAEPSHGVLETAVQAAAELAEIGLHASARALRGAVSRLPRP